ncbi:MAG: hypothetical protein ACK44L_10525 [Burkholderiales bacterium]|jgi:hypothetical protein
MVRRFIALFIALCVSWQALAHSGAGIALTQEQERLHEVLHFHGTAHHHHESSEDLHLDGSLASLTHLVVDNSLFSPALIVGSIAVQPIAPGHRPLPEFTRLWRSAILDRLDRPPRASV